MLLLVDCDSCRLLPLIFVNFKFVEFSQAPVEILCPKLVYNGPLFQADRTNSSFGSFTMCIFGHVFIIFN